MLIDVSVVIESLHCRISPSPINSPTVSLVLSAAMRSAGGYINVTNRSFSYKTISTCPERNCLHRRKVLHQQCAGMVGSSSRGVMPTRCLSLRDGG